MLVVKDLGGEEMDGVNFYLDIDRYSEHSEEDVLMYGINCTINSNIQNTYKDYKSRKLLNLWQPCEFVLPPDAKNQDPYQQVEYFSKIYSICPYTATWLNKKLGDDRHQAIFYPFGNDVIPEVEEKIYDVCYFGGIHGIDHVECIEQISKFNYRFLSLQHEYNPKITDHRVPFKQKMKTVAQTKISVCYNMLYFHGGYVSQIKTHDRWSENEAFAYLDDHGKAPQFKQRVHESAISRTLILCKRDYWNVIEHYYEPEKDFIYFDSNDQLEGLIKDILNNYDDYLPMIESAYNKSLNYTSEKLYTHIRDNNTWI